MTKTTETKAIEHALWTNTLAMNVCRCFEVTIGTSVRNNAERVDYMTYQTDNGIIRCYEIKVTLSDLKSKAHQTFVGDYNYLVITKELFEKVKANGILSNYYFNGVGIYIVEYNNLICKYKPKRQNVKTSMRATILESMLRSSHRELEKLYAEKGYWE